MKDIVLKDIKLVYHDELEGKFLRMILDYSYNGKIYTSRIIKWKDEKNVYPGYRQYRHGNFILEGTWSKNRSIYFKIETQELIFFQLMDYLENESILRLKLMLEY